MKMTLHRTETWLYDNFVLNNTYTSENIARQLNNITFSVFLDIAILFTVNNQNEIRLIGAVTTTMSKYFGRKGTLRLIGSIHREGGKQPESIFNQEAILASYLIQVL